MPLHFDESKIPDPKGEYVAWVDGMGTGQALGSSLSMAANFVMKLHLAFAYPERPASVRLYPLMDGVYVTSPSKDDLEDFLRATYLQLAEEFLGKRGVLDRFLVRCGIAYGATVHGSDIPESAFGSKKKDGFSVDIAKRLESTQPHLLLSAAMVNAFHAESKAAPFGFYVHESALTLPQIVNPEDGGFQDRYWKWWCKKSGYSHETKERATKLALAVRDYFSEASGKTRSLAYPTERQEEHRASAEEYFAELLPKSS